MFEVDSHTSGNTSKASGWVVEEGQNNIFGKVPAPKVSTDSVKYLGQFKSETACWAACNASTVKCDDWTWHHLDFDDGMFAGGCYFTVGGEWSPTPEPKITSARGPYSTSTGHFNFGAGGNQGGEGSEGAGEWFIEGVKEELDQANEFWYDDATHQLFYIPNATAPPADIAVPTLANLFHIEGTQARPAKNISIVGLRFTSSRPTFMEPRTNPSGGDCKWGWWARSSSGWWASSSAMSASSIWALLPTRSL